MDVYEITGFQTGVSRAGVNYLQPSDSFQNIQNGFIHRQVLQSRQGFRQFSTAALADGSRVMGIFQHILADNSIETLAVSQEFLYRYDQGTDTFVQIPNAGSAPVGGFGVVEPGHYVSGTSYPTRTGANRFIFCSEGYPTQIYFYDGTNVRVFNNVVDNPDYAPPPSGALSTARFVARFGERLNFFAPTIAAILRPQAVLYSGIRTISVAGPGDKFNVVGSGMLEADTNEFISGIGRVGNSMVIKFSESDWMLDKTTDAFNPYFVRELPSTTGTSAPFSPIAWGQECRSVGKEGIISCDSRISSRVDDKIPYFTQNDISSQEFNLTYGGFDRQNAQFLWLYKDSGGNILNRFQDRALIHNYEEGSWSVYDMRFSVLGESSLGPELTWDDITAAADPSWSRWDTTTDIWDQIGREATVQKTLAGDNTGFIYQLNQGTDDYRVNIVAPVTLGASTILTTDPQAFAVGDRVAVYNVVGVVNGPASINNYDPASPNALFTPYTVLAVSTTTVTINLDSTDYSAYTSGGLIAKLIMFSAELVPFNPYRSAGRKVYVSHIDFLVDTKGGYLTVDLFADEEDDPFKSGTIARPTSLAKSREWVTISVNNESEFLGLKFTQETPDLQLKVTSIRIYCQPGGLTDA